MSRINIFEKIDKYSENCKITVFPLITGRGFDLSDFRIPSDFTNALGLETADRITDFYKLMQRYSVRLFLHDLFTHKEGAKLSDLLNYSSEKSAKQLLEHLIQLNIVSPIKDKFGLNFNENLRIGDLLEGFTSILLYSEFDIPALNNVSLKGGSVGGDYDILGNWLGKLLFVEAKSAPPKGIHNPEISAFLQRVTNLLPDIAIFLDDTHLRVKDKIVLMFEEELIQLKGIESLKGMPIQRVTEQIFHLNHYVYIMNSKRGLKSNFTIVFRDYLRYNLPVNEIIQ